MLRRWERSEYGFGGFESGLRLAAGKRKPGYDGFRLPLGRAARGGRSVSLWGRVRPASGATNAQVLYRGKATCRVLRTKQTAARGAFSWTSTHRKGRRWRPRWTAGDGTATQRAADPLVHPKVADARASARRGGAAAPRSCGRTRPSRTRGPRRRAAPDRPRSGADAGRGPRARRAGGRFSMGFTSRRCAHARPRGSPAKGRASRPTTPRRPGRRRRDAHGAPGRRRRARRPRRPRADDDADHGTTTTTAAAGRRAGSGRARAEGAAPAALRADRLQLAFALTGARAGSSPSSADTACARPCASCSCPATRTRVLLRRALPGRYTVTVTATNGRQPHEARAHDRPTCGRSGGVHNCGLGSATMAEQLWLLRHGEAEPHDARPDPDRRLTERGEDQARIRRGRPARARAATSTSSSPARRVRALDTARLGPLRRARLRPVSCTRRPCRTASTARPALELMGHGAATDQSASSSSATTPTSSRWFTTSPARARR